MLLNLKKLAIQVPSGEPQVLRLEVQGPKAVTGADLPEIDVEVVNPEVPLFTIEQRRGDAWSWGSAWAAATRRPTASGTAVPAGALALDAAYSPDHAGRPTTSRCPGSGKITDYEKLVVEIWTNGAVSPDDALARAATYLKEHFTPLAGRRPRRGRRGGGRLRRGVPARALAKPIEELPLPARADQRPEEQRLSRWWPTSPRRPRKSWSR